MATNPTLDLLMNRASVRAYTDRVPDDETLATLVRAGQQAPFAYQCCSVILQRKGPFAWQAPLRLLVCADLHRIGLIAARRGWRTRTNDLQLLLFAVQDAAYLAQNMVIAAESLGLGTCYIGSPLVTAAALRERCQLPPKVLPLVGLVLGYPAERPAPRPRYPLDFTLFEERYPELDEDAVAEAMRVMDEGFLAEDYYRKLGTMVAPEGREETLTVDDYSWTEHISRKLQWSPDPAPMLAGLRACGFDLAGAGEDA
ncbi:MAG: nitroreductase family protein [Candidatus Krumholzibacteriota bacterium]|nr:nitroreductase family protein [Candidatus Krumholzibacteriota bacterium]